MNAIKKNKSNNLKIISLRLRPDTAKKLKILATIEGLSMNRVLSEFVDHYINENQDKLAELMFPTSQLEIDLGVSGDR